MDNIPEINVEKLLTSEEAWSRYVMIDDDWIDGVITQEEMKIRINELVEEMKNEANRFQHVYMTENGSCYFQFGDGKSWRFKKDENDWEVQPICNNVFFVPTDEAERLMRERRENPWKNSNGENFIDKPITIDEIGVGRVPFEFGIVGQRKISWEILEGKLWIHGDKSGYFCSGAHFGHKITEVLK